MKLDISPIFVPCGRPMAIVSFVSGGGGNLRACLAEQDVNPTLLRIVLVVADRLGIPALDVAQSRSIPVIARDFEAHCGRWVQCRNNERMAADYRERAERFHDNLLDRIAELVERKLIPEPDLAVLSYRRWIHGRLLAHFHHRMINQHAGDLTVFDNDGVRRFIGINPVMSALREGRRWTRTSTFLVASGHDTGEILCQGPEVQFKHARVSPQSACAHELLQKELSDWPSVRFAIREIAEGHFGLIQNEFHPDGCRIVVHRGRRLPYGGVDLEPTSLCQSSGARNG